MCSPATDLYTIMNNYNNRTYIELPTYIALCRTIITRHTVELHTYILLYRTIITGYTVELPTYIHYVEL